MALRLTSKFAAFTEDGRANIAKVWNGEFKEGFSPDLNPIVDAMLSGDRAALIEAITGNDRLSGSIRPAERIYISMSLAKDGKYRGMKK